MKSMKAKSPNGPITKKMIEDLYREQAREENREVDYSPSQLSNLAYNFIQNSPKFTNGFDPSSFSNPMNRASNTSNPTVSDKDSKSTASTLSQLANLQGRTPSSTQATTGRTITTNTEKTPNNKTLAKIEVTAAIGDIEFFLSDVVDGKVSDKQAEANKIRELVAKGDPFILEVNKKPFTIYFVGDELRVEEPKNLTAAELATVNKISREIKSFFISKQFARQYKASLLRQILNSANI